MMETFGFHDYEMLLSTRPDEYAGTLQIWEEATGALRKVLENLKLKYEIDPGEGVFYGPKIDIKIKDALNREWQCSTIQFDFNEPERFDLTYAGPNNEKERPYMIHRALLGSLERFMGVLIEHYAGALPCWLAPVQVKVLPISEKILAHGRTVAGKLREAGLRAELDDRNEKIGYKIRDAELNKIPYMAVIGEKEQESGAVSVRRHGKGDQGSMSMSDFIALVARQSLPSPESP